MKNYVQHENIIFNIINFCTKNKLSSAKRKYIFDKILNPMIISHYIILCNYLEDKKAFKLFDDKLKKFPILYNGKYVNKFIQIHRKTHGTLLKYNSFINFSSKVKHKLLSKF